MRPEQPWVQPNAANPLGNQAGILARSHAAFGTTTTCKQEVAGPLVRKFQVIIDRLAGLFAQFKSDWPSCLLLSDRCAVRRVSAGSDIFNLDRDDVTATQFTVDCQIEHSEIPSTAFDLEFRPDRPDVFGP
jgi:hypothetical protein